jgi:hypothetical protein
MGRPYYREVAKYLKEMKKIKGFKEEFNGLIKLLKTEYANRPAFLDEMKYFITFKIYHKCSYIP